VRVTIHQPEFAPWIGFFDKAARAETMILLDDVQYRKNYFHNRNKVRTSDGWSWITVPVRRTGLETLLCDARVAVEDHGRWRHKIQSTITQAYGRSQFFASIMPSLDSILEAASDRLVTMNAAIIDLAFQHLGISTKLIWSSDLSVEGTGSDRILNLCRAVGAKSYLSGVSGRDYLDLDSFRREHIDVEFQEFHHPVYDQAYPGFEPQMSVLDALLQMGPEAASLLSNDWTSRLDRVFE
jgi:hypothetical protein